MSNRINSILNFLHKEQNKGQRFEDFVKVFLEKDKTFKKIFKKVYHYKKWKHKWNPKDLGTDLIGETFDGKFWAIQSKLYNKNYSITKSDINSFLSDSNRKIISYRLLIATTNKIADNGYQTIKGQEKPVRLFLLKDFLNLDKVNFNYKKRFNIKIEKPHTPKEFQKKVLKNILNGFKKTDKGKVFLPCGTGKTLIALWSSELLKSNLTVVFVPSIGLISQTVKEWSQNSNYNFSFICICSDNSVVNKDELVESTIDTYLPSTTNPADIKKFFLIKGKKIIFSTYQSSLALSKSLKNKKIDLMICDEAHRCTGLHDSEYTNPLKNELFNVEKRLFFTATKRIYSETAKTTLDKNNIKVYDMNSPDFGSLFYEMKFSEAIKLKLLSDYQVVILGFKDVNYLKMFDKRNLINLTNGLKTDVGTLASHLSVIKSIKKYNLRKIISFHSRVKNAKSFSLDFTKIYSWVPSDQKKFINIWSNHVNGSQKSHEREDIISEFGDRKLSDFSILTNARCLSEGIDVPSVNGIAYIEPKQSYVDIIQSIGRAIRKNKENKKSKIIIPINISDTNNPDLEFENSNYKKIWNVLKALKSHDDNLNDEIDNIRSNLGTKKSSIKLKKIIIDLPNTISNNFVKAFKVSLINKTSNAFPEFLKYLKEFIKVNNNSFVPVNYKINKFKLGRYVNYYRNNYKRKSLSQEYIDILNNIKGWVWSEWDAKWNLQFNLTKEFVELNGIEKLTESTTYKNYNLGVWVQSQKQLKKGKYDLRRGKKIFKTLSPEKIQMFEQINGWIWETPDKWYKNYNILKNYLRNNKLDNIKVETIYNNIKLGNWVRLQRRCIDAFENEGIILRGVDKKKIKLLKKIGISNKSKLDLIWDNNFNILKEFVEKYGWHSIVTGDKNKTNNFKYKGLKLYSFISRERHANLKGSIKERSRKSDYRKKLLLSINFPFDSQIITFYRHINILNSFLKKNNFKSIYQDQNKKIYDSFYYLKKKFNKNKIPQIILKEIRLIPNFSIKFFNFTSYKVRTSLLA